MYHGFWFYVESWLTWISQSVAHQIFYGSFTSNLNWKTFIEPVYAGTGKTITATHGSGGSGSPVIDTSITDAFGGNAGTGKFVAAERQYLSSPASNDWYFTGDFTIDFWVKWNSLGSTFEYLVSQHVDGNNRWELYTRTHAPWLAFNLVSGGTTLVNFSTRGFTPSTGTWYHVALVRSDNNWYIFVGGTQYGTTSNSSSFANLSTSLLIGEQAGAQFLDGWLDEFRISNGIARWTSSFTPPTTEYSSDGYTVLLLHMNGSNGGTTFTDSEANTNTPEYVALQSEYQMLQHQLNQTQAQNKQLQTTISQQSTMINQLNQQLTSANGTALTYQLVAVVCVIIAAALVGLRMVRSEENPVPGTEKTVTSTHAVPAEGRPWP